MNDNLRPDSTNVINTVFLEQRALNTQPAQEANIMTIPRSIEMEMSDDMWMARDQLKKPILLEQVAWNVTQTPGTNLAVYEFPEILTSVESIVRRTLSMYAYFRFTPVFRFQINATKFHQGQLICSFDPFSQSIDYTDRPTDYTGYFATPFFNRFGATGLPNVKIMASESDPVELEIPFNHPRNYFTTNSSAGFDLLGKVRVTVLNQLKVADGASTSLTLTTWLYARDASVHVPIHYHDLVIPDYAPIESTSLLDNVTDLIGNGTNLVGNIMTGQVGKALRTGQGIVDNLGSIFGFDYPTRPVNPEKCIMPIETLAHGKGVSRAQRLVVDPVSHHPTGSEESSSATDPMDIMAALKTPMLYYQMNWTTTQTAGTQLYTKTVAPVSSIVNVYTQSGRNIYQPTFLAYIASKFQFWRGGITYTLEFIATHFHSGKLLVAYVPNNMDPTKITYEQLTSSCPNIVVDIQQTSSVSFTVPYVSPTPLKCTLNESTNTLDEEIIGHWFIYIQNPLVAASNVANNIDINIYAQAADDFQVFVPRKSVFLPCSYLTAASVEAPITSTSDIRILTNTETSGQPQASMAYGTTEIAPRPRFGENYALIDILRRYDLVRLPTLTAVNSSDPTAQCQYHIVSPTHVNDPYSRKQSPSSLLNYFSTMFSAWTGSLRYKIITSADRTSKAYLTVIHTPVQQNINYQEELNNGYASTRTNLAQDNALEYEVPFYTPYNMLLTMPPAMSADREYTEPIDNGFVNMIYSVNPLLQSGSDPVKDTVQLYMAAGEDFRLLYRRCPPTVVYYQPTDLYDRSV